MVLKVYTHNVFLVILFTLFLYSQLFSLKITKRNEMKSQFGKETKLKKKSFFALHLFFAIQSYAFVIFLNILDFLGITWILLKSFGFFAIFWSGEHFIIFWSSYDHFDKLQKWNWFFSNYGKTVSLRA